MPSLGSIIGIDVSLLIFAQKVINDVMFFYLWRHTVNRFSYFGHANAFFGSVWPFQQLY